MLDTIRLNINYIEQGLTFDKVSTLFSSNVYEHHKQDGDNFFITGHNDTWNLKANDKVFTLTGSIAKSINETNFFTPTRSQIVDYFNTLSDKLNMNLFKSNISRVDVANNVIMEETPKMYYKYLGEEKGWTKKGYDGTELWKNRNKETKLMYDKSKWALDTNNTIPVEYENKNILRWEYRCLSNNALTKVVGKHNTKLGSLLDEPNYLALFQKSIDQYNNIPKINNIDFMIDNIKTPRQALDGLFVTLVQNSNEAIIKNYLDTLESKGVFKNRQQKYRVKSMVNKKLATHRGRNDYIDELDNKINNIIAT